MADKPQPMQGLKELQALIVQEKNSTRLLALVEEFCRAYDLEYSKLPPEDLEIR